MPINQETLNRRLYKILHNRFDDATGLDSEGKVSPIEDEADVFRFTFTKDGEKYGTVYITVDNSRTLKIYYDDDIADSPDSPTPGVGYDDTWYGLLQFLKRWSKDNQLGWEPTNKKHLQNDMARRNHMKKQENMMEGYYPMGKKASYSDNVPNVKMVIQHTREIQEGEQRYRNVAKIFLENSEGERILAPTTKPGIARVYARHIAEGGLPHDERWNHIKGLCEEYSKMGSFVRATRGKQFNESAQGLIESGINHYNSLRESLSKLAGHRGYNMYFESWTPPLMEDDTDTSSITELFVQETMDPRIESVMPILSKLHKTVAEMREVDALAEWADSLLEGGDGGEADDDAEKGITAGDEAEEAEEDLTEAPGAETLKHNQDTEASNLKAFGLAEEESLTSNNPVGIPEDKGGAIEAHGVHGMKSKPWRKTFKNQAAFEAWLEKNEGNVEVHGTREVEQDVEEGLDANQKRVGQLGPTEKVGPQGAVGKLVGACESIESTLKALDMLSENFINTDAQAVVTEEAFVSDDVWRIAKQISKRYRKHIEDFGSEEVDMIADQVGLSPSDVAEILELTEGVNEGADYGDLENEYYYVIDTQTGEVVDGPFDNVGEVPLRLMGFDGGHAVKKGAELKGLDDINEGQEDLEAMLRIIKK